MKLECPHCGDSFTYAPETGGTVISCRYCRVPFQLPTVAQLAPEKRQELQNERQAALRKEQRQAEKALKKAEGQRRREEKEQQQVKERAEINVQASPPSLPPVPSLVACPDCNHAVSPQATTCPKCGRPMSAQTIEKTGKKLKAFQFASVGLFMIGALGLITLASANVQSERAWVAFFLMAVAGLPLWLFSRLLAWWFHG